MKNEQIIETILLACAQPISNHIIRRALNNDLTDDQIGSIINNLNDEYARNGKGIYIDFIANGYQVRTLPEFHKYISIIKDSNYKYKLTHAAFEVLSIIAFKQPISKIDIEKLRGVDSIGIIKNLLDKKLITITGREDRVGRALLYGTTSLFLETFGLNKIEDLPKTSEVKEIIQNEIK